MTFAEQLVRVEVALQRGCMLTAHDSKDSSLTLRAERFDYVLSTRAFLRREPGKGSLLECAEGGRRVYDEPKELVRTKDVRAAAGAFLALTTLLYVTRMCTRCPTPCALCRQGATKNGFGLGPYCEKTPCDCRCHTTRAALTAADGGST
ncbi:MAG TPA: hypothetical protein VGI39_18005 [Polyangiaceae bacterium]